MNKFLIRIFVLLVVFDVRAQIQNSGFEIWNMSDPNLWQTSNSLAPNSVSQETVNPGNGLSSVLLTTTACSICPSMNLPNKISYIEQKTAYVGKPDSLSFLYKSNIQVADEGIISIICTKAGQVTCYGNYFINSSMNTNTWRIATINLSYMQNTNSDSIDVFISSSDSAFRLNSTGLGPTPQLGSNLSIDDIVVYSGGVSIQQFEKNTSEITIFPNPNNGEMFISGNGITNTELNIEINDLTGRILYKQILPIENGLVKVKADLPNGAYFVTIKGSYAPVTQKIIVNK